MTESSPTMANLVFDSAALEASDVVPDIVAPAKTRVKDRARAKRSKDSDRAVMMLIPGPASVAERRLFLPLSQSRVSLAHEESETSAHGIPLQGL